MILTKVPVLGILFLSLIKLSLTLHHSCHHDKMELEIEIVHEDEPPRERRMLESEYKNIRIYADFSLLTSDINPRLKAYIQDELMPPAINYYQETLKVIPRPTILDYKKDSVCGLPTPAIYRQGVEADLGLIVNAANEDTSYIAYARACTVQNSDSRPTLGNVHFNLKYLKIGGVKQHEQNLIVAIHEMAHVLGISRGLFEFYYDSETGKAREGHVKQRELNGITTFFIDVEPLTSKLRDFFGCPAIEGALLENEGDEASKSHLERRVFFHEIMTAGEMKDARISEFTLAFLEGTGWYKGNYNMSEPVFWGKGKGCDFYYSPCVDRNTYNPSYEEFCPHLTEVGCSVTRRLGASCGSRTTTVDPNALDAFNHWGNHSVVKDMFSDNCPYFVPTSNKDCEDPYHQYTAFLMEEAYGEGSKCYSGNLRHPGQMTGVKTNYCFKSSCELQSDGNFFLNVTVGSTRVTCKNAGPIAVLGFEGKMDCPDPNEYCSTFGKPYCEKGCGGKGQCIDDKCYCVDGWGGNDCSIKTYVHSCKRCKNFSKTTSCYGDECYCNPNDVGCEMKRLPDFIADDEEYTRNGFEEDEDYGGDNSSQEISISNGNDKNGNHPSSENENDNDKNDDNDGNKNTNGNKNDNSSKSIKIISVFKYVPIIWVIALLI